MKKIRFSLLVAIGILLFTAPKALAAPAAGIIGVPTLGLLFLISAVLLFIALGWWLWDTFIFRANADKFTVFKRNGEYPDDFETNVSFWATLHPTRPFVKKGGFVFTYPFLDKWEDGTEDDSFKKSVFEVPAENLIVEILDGTETLEALRPEGEATSTPYVSIKLSAVLKVLYPVVFMKQTDEESPQSDARYIAARSIENYMRSLIRSLPFDANSTPPFSEIYFQVLQDMDLEDRVPEFRQRLEQEKTLSILDLTSDKLLKLSREPEFKEETQLEELGVQLSRFLDTNPDEPFEIREARKKTQVVKEEQQQRILQEKSIGEGARALVKALLEGYGKYDEDPSTGLIPIDEDDSTFIKALDTALERVLLKEYPRDSRIYKFSGGERPSIRGLDIES